TELDDVDPEFEINVGKSGQVFKEDSKTGHRFFALAKDMPGWEKRFELSKLEAGFDRIKTPKGNIVKVSIYADEIDLEKNIQTSRTISDALNHELDVMPHLNLQSLKNPEFRDSKGIRGDRISPDWTNVKTATN